MESPHACVCGLWYTFGWFQTVVTSCHSTAFELFVWLSFHLPSAIKCTLRAWQGLVLRPFWLTKGSVTYNQGTLMNAVTSRRQRQGLRCRKLMKITKGQKSRGGTRGQVCMSVTMTRKSGHERGAVCTASSEGWLQRPRPRDAIQGECTTAQRGWRGAKTSKRKGHLCGRVLSCRPDAAGGMVRQQPALLFWQGTATLHAASAQCVHSPVLAWRLPSVEQLAGKEKENAILF